MPSFTYTTDIPAATHDPSVDQSPMQVNCNSIASILNQDLYGFGTGNDGYHQQVTFPAVHSAPTVTPPAGIVTTQTSNSKSELFYTNSTANAQITNTSLSASAGEGMLPGGLLIKCGVGSTAGAQTFTTAFPTSCISVVATTSSSGSQVNITAKSTTSFTAVASPSGTVSYYWIAVGY